MSCHPTRSGTEAWQRQARGPRRRFNFRIFNPYRQAERFDPDGAYVDRWVPREELQASPIVDVAQSRREALAEYRRVKNGTGGSNDRAG